MNTERFFTLWFLSVCSVFKISSTCDPRHVGALFPLALNICSKHMFHAAYAKAAVSFCFVPMHNPACWNLNFKCSTASWEFKWSLSSDRIGEKLGISRPLRQNSSQGSHMSTVCVYSSTCLYVCVCVANMQCMCVLEGGLLPIASVH